MIHKSMPSVQSSPAQYSAVFSDVVRFEPKRDRYGIIVGWDLNNIREPYRKNFKSEEHYLRWKRWWKSITRQVLFSTEKIIVHGWPN